MRLLSLVPSITELLYDLGVGERVVGVTRFCVRPEGWKREKKIVGGTKNVNVDAVRALRPDLVLANKEENTRADVEALSAFVPVHVTDVATLPDALAMIREVGALVGVEAQARTLAAEIAAGFEALPRVPMRRTLYFIWRDPWMSIGGDTFIHDMMQRGGFENVCGSQMRYPALTVDEIQALAPELVLLSSEPFPFREKHIAEIKKLLPDAEARLVDGELFSWYGSRLRHTPAYLRTLHHQIMETP